MRTIGNKKTSISWAFEYDADSRKDENTFAYMDAGIPELQEKPLSI
ncbi:MAG: hypothetical protein KJO69_07690 [Gammaproteobacteria bacterium]|nr:hypothetical protein [Gammaproteobacteria bacterium]